MSETQELTFAKRLKEQTTTTHDSVDNLVMSVQPFASKENYIKFLKLQSVFHKAVDHIYKDAELNKAIPELEYMARYDAVTQDLKDLGEEPYKFDKELPHETRSKTRIHRRIWRTPPGSSSERPRQTLARFCRASECFELDSGS